MTGPTRSFGARWRALGPPLFRIGGAVWFMDAVIEVAHNRPHWAMPAALAAGSILVSILLEEALAKLEKKP